MDWNARTGLLLGEQGLRRLAESTVAVFGVGGVGSYVVEALARCGVGALALFDGDRVAPTNLNRQLIATLETVGQLKVEAAKARVLSINPACRVSVYPVYYTPQNAGEYPLAGYDYLVDAIDMVSSKLELAVRAKAAQTPLISCMGAGNKLDPTRFEVADLYETSVCPLARVMRRELRARGVERLTVVYSRETPRTPIGDGGEPAGRRQTPGSVSFVPAAAGLVAASHVIRALTQI